MMKIHRDNNEISTKNDIFFKHKIQRINNWSNRILYLALNSKVLQRIFDQDFFLHVVVLENTRTGFTPFPKHPHPCYAPIEIDEYRDRWIFRSFSINRERERDDFSIKNNNNNEKIKSESSPSIHKDHNELSVKSRVMSLFFHDYYFYMV